MGDYAPMEDRKQAAQQFANRWKGKGNEKSDTRDFWRELLHDVCGVEDFGLGPENRVMYPEMPIQIGKSKHDRYIDVFIVPTATIIEQKSLGVDLDKPQAGHENMTPFEQAKQYRDWLPASKQGMARWIIVCNFSEFRIYDMEHPKADPDVIMLANLGKEWRKLQFLVDAQGTTPKDIQEVEVSVKAGEFVGELYDALKGRYVNPESEKALRSLNILCVRLVFLLYADDSGLFPQKGMFHDYLKERQITARRALIDLFSVLDKKPEERDPYEKELNAFPYVNGGLFEEKDIEIPQIDGEPLKLLLDKMSAGFDWSGISPTIFGAVFESTLNEKTRRIGGMHYTSTANIHRVIDPLFLNDLRDELKTLMDMPDGKKRIRALADYQEKLSTLTFLDPACGSGNFLTETYLSLRRLENQALKERTHQQLHFAEGDFTPIRVSIGQFYGIEINDFAVAVARTALWIAEAQMMEETRGIVDIRDDVLPLKSYNHIVEGNALTMDWAAVVPQERLSFIIGNPPFRGARLMDATQKAELTEVFKGWNNIGNLDYVSCWYKKAADMMKGTAIRAALVSTNSITQGDSVAILWRPLFSEGVHIDFAWRTFIWNSEATDQAHVHCVIVGFSCGKAPASGVLYDVKKDGAVSVTNTKHINGYLVDAPDIFVESRQRPICDVPEIGIGNKPIDGGNYLFKKDEMEAFIKKEPTSVIYFHPWYGADEFINRRPRYCLYLGNCPPGDLRKMPECLKRVEAVKEYRQNSTSPGTRKLAETPRKFHVTNIPNGNYIVIPEVSSERRRYIPMGFMDSSVLCSNKVRLMPEATLYHFGVLESSIHMAWMRTVCGRLKSDYDYSIKIVYNNFPWPSPTEQQREKIERTAQAILDAREKEPDSSLADLYDERSMPDELRAAHRANDAAVCAAYGFSKNITDEEIVARLMGMYQAFIGTER